MPMNLIMLTMYPTSQKWLGYLKDGTGLLNIYPVTGARKVAKSWTRLSD